MPTESSVVYQEIQDMPTESSVVYKEIQNLLATYSYRIPMSCLEKRYEEKFKRFLDYDSLGVDTIEELLFKMCDEGWVQLGTDSDSNETYVTCARLVGSEIPPPSSFEDKYKGSSEIQDMQAESSEIQDMPMESCDVYQEIHYVLASYFHGIPKSWLETAYRQDFNRSLDYKSLGAENIDDLISQMHEKDRVVLYEDPESKETYVMCARFVESLQKLLKLGVQDLLDTHGGQIPIRLFERRYKKKFKVKLNYHHYGLTGLEHLCQVLNLGLEETDSPGEKVIKAGDIYNIRTG